MRLGRFASVKVRGARRRALGSALLAAAFAVTAVSGVSAHGSKPAADPSVITFWNEVAFQTIVVDAGKANAQAFPYYAFAQAAVYNAVNGITRKYQLYKWNGHPQRGASPQAAAAAAAYRTLLNYFPLSQTRLDTAYAASLALISDSRAKTRGIAYGERAAARIVALRLHDGRDVALPFTKPLGPGVWRPTPPGLVPFFSPWLSKVTPLTLKSPSQFRPEAPPALTSARYAKDFEEVKLTGGATGSTRTPLQTQTALFFSDIATGALTASLRDLATRHKLNISDSARLFAAVTMSVADSVFAVWDSKFHFGFWRPITAIQEAGSDGNDATMPNANWVPLLITPPYPDYASGLSGAIGALSRSLTRIMHTSHIDLNIRSVAAGTPGFPLLRHYETAGQLTQGVIDARVWSGIHFRFADTVGVSMGRNVADYALSHYFKPVHDEDDD
jgi:hypothetical protein